MMSGKNEEKTQGEENEEQNSYFQNLFLKEKAKNLKIEEEKLKIQEEKLKIQEEKLKIQEELNMEKEEKLKIQEELKQADAIAEGKYFTYMSKVWEPNLISYEGAFKKVHGRSDEWDRPSEYQGLVQALKDLANDSKNASDISIVSNSSGSQTNSNNNHSTGRNRPNMLLSLAVKKDQNDNVGIMKDFMGEPGADRAHLIPSRSTACAPFYGILGQYVYGLDLEAIFSQKMKADSVSKEEMDNLRDKVIKLLQLSIISGQRPKGLSSTKINLICMPKGGHKFCFDDSCRWFVVPVMSLEQALKWTSDTTYSVMVVTGALEEHNQDSNLSEDGKKAKDSAFLSLEVDAAKVMIKVNYEKSTNKGLLDSEEIKLATEGLADVVAALADLATGREGSNVSPLNLKPLDLENRNKTLDQKKKDELQEATEKLKGQENKVTIPKVTYLVSAKQSKVLKVDLTNHYGHCIPDPLLLFIKSAINWMVQNKERPLPACGEDSSESQSENSTESDILEAVSPPMTYSLPTLIQYSNIVTPPRQCRSSSQNRESSEDPYDSDLDSLGST